MKSRLKILFLTLFVFLSAGAALGVPARGDAWLGEEPVDTFTVAIRNRLDTLLVNDIFDRTQLGLYVYDLTADRPLYARGERQCMRPASCMKVMTAVTALQRLGGDYKYRTELYRTDASAPAVEASALVCDSAALSVDSTATPLIVNTTPHTASIAIRGGMDPIFGADDLRAFIQALRADSITAITGSIILDVSLKDTTSLGWGWCWDDKAVPLTPLLYSGKANFESRLRQALKDAGIAFDGNFIRKTIPNRARLLTTRTHTIDQILQPMMKKSNNLYAETLFFQLPQTHRYASHKDAAAQVNSLISLTGHNTDHYQVADGSGLSLYNYVTAELLVDVLRYAYANREIYNHLLPSLPIMGRDGTLRKRCVGTSAQDRVQAKTGTVTGVSSLAGYALAPNGHQLVFAIINQGVRHTATGRNFQDRVCQALTQPLNLPDAIEPDPLANPAEDEDAEEEEE